MPIEDSRPILVDRRTLYHSMKALQTENLRAITEGEGSGHTTLEMVDFLLERLSEWRIKAPRSEYMQDHPNFEPTELTKGLK